jgi:signal transduction histidine kinase
LQQAFVNLLLNALEAMGENGVLMVATEIAPADTATASGDPLRKERIRLTIQDNGIGIPPENMERLFEPFFTTKPNGTGLGLAITRRIIQDHGGVISVESTPGKGTAFNIVFPVPGNML